MPCDSDGNDAETISANNIPGAPTIHFTNVRCMGEEKSITECPMLEDWNLRCNSRNRVGVSCVKRSCNGGNVYKLYLTSTAKFTTLLVQLQMYYCTISD